MRLTGMFVAGLLASAIAAADAQDSSRAPFPPPGRLIDVGGWKLHLNCAGAKTGSQPIVILE